MGLKILARQALLLKTVKKVALSIPYLPALSDFKKWPENMITFLFDLIKTDVQMTQSHLRFT